MSLHDKREVTYYDNWHKYEWYNQNRVADGVLSVRIADGLVIAVESASKWSNTYLIVR